MKIIIYLSMGLLLGCAIKQKAIESKASKSQTIAQVQSIQSQKQRVQSYQISIDTSKMTNWFKIYPKDVFVVDNNGFKGAADSLIWYGNRVQLSWHQQIDQQDQEQIFREVSRYKELTAATERKKEVAKGRISLWWLIIVCACAICIFFFGTKKFKM